MQIVKATQLNYIPASHEDFKNPGSYKKVLIGPGMVQQGKLMMINWSMIPKGSAFASHYHEDLDEVFIIMKGSVRIQVEEEQAYMEKGDAVVIKAGSIHKMWNHGDDDVEYIALGVASGDTGKTIVTE